MVYLFLADGFEEIEALAPVDILRRGNVAVKTVSVHENRTVKGAHGIRVEADLLLNEIDEVPTFAVLPGGLRGVENLGASEALCRLLKTYKDDGVTLAAICAAPTLLSKLGLICGRTVTCYPSCAPEITDGVYVDAPVCVQDGLVTSAGPGTAAAFGLMLLYLSTDEETLLKIGRGGLFMDEEDRIE
ncbi:MAG: DJ-1/PfpI family protein [Clostridia bacterium]|nr:DJ-1/PfpI family protein [Clostridia bacterium]